jgi:hypothetical protein
LNRAGRLQLREPELENKITSQHADLAIRRSIEEAADVEGPAERIRKTTWRYASVSLTGDMLFLLLTMRCAPVARQ